MRLFFILFIVIVIYVFYTHETSENAMRHLTSSYGYAHFSKITMKSWMLYPSLLFTHPIHIVLNEGESMFIPSKWWHWVRTEPNSYAINFWFNGKEGLPEKPEKIQSVIDTYTSENIVHEINTTIQEYKYIPTNKRPTFWYNDTDTITKDLKYFITLDGYSNIMDENIKIKDSISKYVPIESLRKRYAKDKSDFNFNLWCSYNNMAVESKLHDTGLHYDDTDGVLHVLKGKKTITFYPPSDSPCLYPFDVTPDYARQPAAMFFCNEYHFMHTSSGKSSAYLLYKTLQYHAASPEVLKAVQEIYNNKVDNKPLIWGFKKTDDVYRWEFYHYHWSQHDINITEKDNIMKTFPTNSSVIQSYRDVLMYDNTLIHSIDVLNQADCYNKELHTYECDGMRVLPFYGSGYDNVDSKKTNMCRYIFHYSYDFKRNYKRFLRQLNLRNDMRILLILMKYWSLRICVWNKHGKIFIQWLTISIEDFISFLKEFKYKKDFVEFVEQNKEDFRNISHEVTIVYDEHTLETIRTSFYGSY